jgi:hypothetical protein
MESLVGADVCGGKCSRRQRRPLSIAHMQQHKAHANTTGVRGCVCVCACHIGACIGGEHSAHATQGACKNKCSVQACISPALASAAFFTSRGFSGLSLTERIAKIKPQPSSLRPEVAVDDGYVLLVNLDSLDALPKGIRVTQTRRERSSD